MTKLLAQAGPDMIPLSGGFPNPAMFPFESLELKVAGGSAPLKLSGKEMQAALQYLPTPGHPGLLRHLRNMQERIHSPDTRVWSSSELVVTSGSQDGLCKSIEMLLEPGDPIILEQFVYSGTLSILNPYKPVYHQVNSDQEGMIPEHLQEVLEGVQDRGDKMPKFMYINPTGANPTGTMLPNKRRRQIYNICSKYDILILEDDPYFFLQFGDEDSRPQSFFSMDVDGRVLRFDSFSKVLSSGIRLGWVTGPKPLVDRVMLHMQVSVLHAASLSQAVTAALLDQWGYEGLMSHVKSVESFYKVRRDLLLKAADKHLAGLASYWVPQGGMFLWIQVPSLSCSWDMVMSRGMERGIMLMPGRAFQPDPSKPCPYLRAAFSIAPEEKFEPAMERLATLIKEEIQLSHNQ